MVSSLRMKSRTRNHNSVSTFAALMASKVDSKSMYLLLKSIGRVINTRISASKGFADENYSHLCLIVKTFGSCRMPSFAAISNFI